MTTSDAMQILRANPDDATTVTKIAFAAKRHWEYPERWVDNWREKLTITPEFIAGSLGGVIQP